MDICTQSILMLLLSLPPEEQHWCQINGEKNPLVGTSPVCYCCQRCWNICSDSLTSIAKNIKWHLGKDTEVPAEQTLTPDSLSVTLPVPAVPCFKYREEQGQGRNSSGEWRVLSKSSALFSLSHYICIWDVVIFQNKIRTLQKLALVNSCLSLQNILSIEIFCFKAKVHRTNTKKHKILDQILELDILGYYMKMYCGGGDANVRSTPVWRKLSGVVKKITLLMFV